MLHNPCERLCFPLHLSCSKRIHSINKLSLCSRSCMCVRGCLFMFFKCDELLAIARATHWKLIHAIHYTRSKERDGGAIASEWERLNMSKKSAYWKSTEVLFPISCKLIFKMGSIFSLCSLFLHLSSILPAIQKHPNSSQNRLKKKQF